MSDAPQSGISLAQIYLVSATFGHRGNALALPSGTAHKPQKVSVLTSVVELNNGTANQIVVHVASRPEDEESLYDFSVEIAAIIQKNDTAPTFSGDLLAEIGTAWLYPFAREAVANITGRGRFGPIWLNPFNVRAALDARRAAAAESEEKRATV